VAFLKEVINNQYFAFIALIYSFLSLPFPTLISDKSFTGLKGTDLWLDFGVAYCSFRGFNLKDSWDLVLGSVCFLFLVSATAFGGWFFFAPCPLEYVLFYK